MGREVFVSRCCCDAVQRSVGQDTEVRQVQEPRDDIDAEGAQEAVRLQELLVSEVRVDQGETADYGGAGVCFIYLLTLS